ncbi:MAG: Tol-Pal system beta propeller repeat protein TolB, partial [Pseudomonadota bacterium]
MKRFVLCLVLFLGGQVASADLRIEVTKGVDNAVRVAVIPFAIRGKSVPETSIRDVIDADLTLSGRFETLPIGQMLSLPRSGDDVFQRDWQVLKVEYLIMGSVSLAEDTLGDDAVVVTFELYNVFKGAVEARQTISGSREEIRDLAHHISDVVFEELTGIRGVFATQILYVTASGPVGDRRFRLNVADADGYRVQTLLESTEPIMSGTWSPTGDEIAYVSFEDDGRPGIYVLDVGTGRAKRVAQFEGINGAPAFSPDGRQLAMVLSRGDNPDIYILNLETNRLRQVTRHYLTDTEPSWTPDGRNIVFTSDRGGKPQIYKVALDDLSLERLTFEGDYNARASMLPGGQSIVMVHRRNEVFHIALLDLIRGRLMVLTETELDESPSVAPNGS